MPIGAHLSQMLENSHDMGDVGGVNSRDNIKDDGPLVNQETGSASGSGSGSGSASGDGMSTRSSESPSSSSSARGPGKVDSMVDMDARESRQVFWSKVLVVIVLLASATGVGVFIYDYASQEDYNDFYSQSHSDAETIERAAEGKIETLLDTMKIMANTFSREANQVQEITNSSTAGPWPLFTMPNFESAASRARDMSGALLLAVVPLVSAHHRESWEQYSTSNQGWIEKGFEFLEEEDENPNTLTNRITPFIHRTNNDTSYVPVREEDHYNSSDPYAPLWQISPPPQDAGIVNNNFYHNVAFRRLASRVVKDGEPGISEVDDMTSYFGSLALEEEEYKNEPQSLAIVPIFGTFRPDDDDEFSNVMEKDDHGHEEKFIDHDGSVVVGFLVAVVTWGNLISEVLNDHSHSEAERKRGGIVAVLRQSPGCSAEGNFSYHILGPYVTYLGTGDEHDITYDHEVVSTDLSFMNFLRAEDDHEDHESDHDEDHESDQESDHDEDHDEDHDTDQDSDHDNDQDSDHDTDQDTEHDRDHDTDQDSNHDNDHDMHLSEEGQNDFSSKVDSHDEDSDCRFLLDIYPTSEYETNYQSNEPLLFTGFVLAVFLFTTIVFALYDFFVSRRQRKVRSHAVRSNAIVNSLFPAQIRDKLYGTEDEQRRQQKFGVSNGFADVSKNTFLVNENATGGDWQRSSQSGQIADLFPSATVCFTDIAGFTSWSSQREPGQVFLLLETIYHSFDKIATRRKVFKVETIGDCYVAVCGLPDPNDDHAVVMARFALDCMKKMKDLVNQLESTLGPDTADLECRVGLHSGPVTAGVLRGERARFQLFGDTVNTAARMESTGSPGRAQITQATSELLELAGKAHWFSPREEKVEAKGKGVIQTYWLVGVGVTKSLSHVEEVAMANSCSSSRKRGVDADGKSLASLTSSQVPSNIDSAVGDDSPSQFASDLVSEKTRRLVRYNRDLLLIILRKMSAKRRAGQKRNNRSIGENEKIRKLEASMGKNGICVEEVVEIIDLPPFDPAAYGLQDKTVEGLIPTEVEKQLTHYVEMIAKMYKDNAFHNFDHASHVTQSTSKLLSRIVAVENRIEVEQDMHDSTYGITSDPLTQFSVILASLIHDVDHRGVPNFLLVTEDPAMGELYKNQAVAEQNSLDISWTLLMDPAFDQLRAAIYSTAAELQRFRQLLVNCLMATDIFDKELSALRKSRWNKAFSCCLSDAGQELSSDSDAEAINRKATIVIEHIIQASDVSHTMQHWHVYSKWNERLYREMYSAYRQGRSQKDPTDGWYQGELWFYDNYVIPLVGKLKECGVFGVSGDEYLDYALANRREWEKKGQSIVETYRRKYKS